MNQKMIYTIIALSIMLFTSILTPFAFAQEIQEKLTINSRLLVKLSTVPKIPTSTEETKLKIEFVNPQTLKVQEHVDYEVSVEKNVKTVFETDLTHTSLGVVTIPITFDEDGKYDVTIEVFGILFSPIPKDTAIFSVDVGQVLSGHEFVNPKQTSIPNWIKQNAGWWADGAISDSDFVSGIQYLIENKIMTIPETHTTESNSDTIPQWVKNNAGWWSKDHISDSDFVSGIQYLITSGIMKI